MTANTFDKYILQFSEPLHFFFFWKSTKCHNDVISHNIIYFVTIFNNHNAIIYYYDLTCIIFLQNH